MPDLTIKDERPRTVLIESQGPMAHVGKGTVGGAMAYLLVVVPTEWIRILPPIPAEHFLPIMGALATVISAGLILWRSKSSPSATQEPADG